MLNGLGSEKVVTLNTGGAKNSRFAIANLFNFIAGFATFASLQLYLSFKDKLDDVQKSVSTNTVKISAMDQKDLNFDKQLDLVEKKIDQLDVKLTRLLENSLRR